MKSNHDKGSVVFDHVIKNYGDVTAINDVSFRVEPGNLVTLLGPSGCGKTTTLRMIAGLEHASAGRILISGKDVTQLPATDRDVSMVFQSYALFPHMSVVQNVAYGLVASGVNKQEAHAKSEDALALVGLHGYGERLPSELSGGQQQRVAVARALVLEPEVLLLDEPLSNLDAKLRRQVREEIRELQQKLGLTAVYVTHDQEEAMAVSDRIIVMNKSIIAQEGSPKTLYEEPNSSFIADFIGDANLVDVEILDRANDRVNVDIAGLQKYLPAREFSLGPAKLAIRPDAIQLTASAGNQVGITGNIRHATYLGNQMQYDVECELGSLFVVDYQFKQGLIAGSDVQINFADRGLVLVKAN
ncbi:sugar ABC transporter substrate-binding protein [Marinomonas sp. SBI22]|uniref:ABC transporter ATP-binding protein n=1 Tax=unclassified Marinomonas TaxID=196814 RepID=UPI0007AF98CB|nr:MULTISPECIES: ABC transporter ATP-binding protein [unclassified Marinomonas]KZM45837.1 sugar ABC transporter substrate-binding protein [Marinomonas sp. SBI22]KZM46355.1 sugar ABC transporter substrate-binding protein [Marinomonas sp. SBI8L]